MVAYHSEIKKFHILMGLLIKFNGIRFPKKECNFRNTLFLRTTSGIFAGYGCFGR